MKKFIILLFIFTLTLVSCTTKAPDPESIFYTEAQVKDIIADGHLYTIHEFIDKYMTEEGNYLNDSIHRYRTRATKGDGVYLFSMDTLPSTGEGIYIRARVETDDEGGNFYKTFVLQQLVNGEQQNLRVGVDAGSISGLYPRGQELIIRCNGLAIGRYANQIQLCTPSYNNNIYANKESEKVGWAPGRIDVATFKRNSWRIGMPDESKLQIDTILITDYINKLNIVENRKYDGRLVCITGVHYTGQLNDNGEIKNCSFNNPETATDANVFAPTTENMNYPQSRYVEDINGNLILISVSEYAKMARFYIPGAGSAYDGEYQYTISKNDTQQPTEGSYLPALINGTTYYVMVPPERVSYGFHMDDVIFIPDATKETEKALIYDGSQWVNKVGILHCPEYSGSVKGVLSFYMDNAKYDAESSDWAISICDISDIKMKTAEGTPWNPIEYSNKNK